MRLIDADAFVQYSREHIVWDTTDLEIHIGEQPTVNAIPNNVFVFSIQDNVCGIIFAQTADEARKQISKQRGIEMRETFCGIYSLADAISDEKNFGVIDLL